MKHRSDFHIWTHRASVVGFRPPGFYEMEFPIADRSDVDLFNGNTGRLEYTLMVRMRYEILDAARHRR